MSKSIDQKIAKLILGLRVRDNETLLSNMEVIEKRINKMPALLDWMEPLLELDDSFRINGFSHSYSVEMTSMVRLWVLALQARFGNLTFRYAPALDIHSWTNPILPHNLNELQGLRWLRCASYPRGPVPDRVLLWILASAYTSLSDEIKKSHRWVLELDCPPPPEVYNIVGVDGFDSSIDIWQSWSDAISWESVQFLRLCPRARNLDVLQEAHSLKVLDCSTLENQMLLQDPTLSFSELMVLTMHQIGLTEIPRWVRSSIKLRRLQIGWNPLTVLPEWFDELQNLTHLHCAHTQFKNFPVQISNNSNLTNLIIRSDDSKNTRAWLTEVRELNKNCTIGRERSFYTKSLWNSAIQIFG